MIEKSEINVVPLPTEEVTAQIQKTGRNQRVVGIFEIANYIK